MNKLCVRLTTEKENSLTHIHRTQSHTHTYLIHKMNNAKNSHSFFSRSCSLSVRVCVSAGVCASVDRFITFFNFFLFVQRNIKTKLPSHLHQSIINVRNESYFFHFTSKKTQTHNTSISMRKWCIYTSMRMNGVHVPLPPPFLSKGFARSI